MVVIEAKLPSGYSPDKKSMVEVRSPLSPSGIPHPTGPCPLGAVGHRGTHLLGVLGTHRAAVALPEPCPCS